MLRLTIKLAGSRLRVYPEVELGRSDIQSSSGEADEGDEEGDQVHRGLKLSVVLISWKYGVLAFGELSVSLVEEEEKGDGWCVVCFADD